MSSRQIQQSELDGRKIELVGRSEGDQELYIEGIHGVQSTGAVMKLNFYTLGIDTSRESERRESVCRLVLGTPQFFQMADFLTKLAADLRAAAQQARNQTPSNPAGTATRQ